MSRTSSRRPSMESIKETPVLPSWMLDVDETDEINMDTPILQELEIDVSYIWRNSVWMFIGPWSSLCGRNTERHPLQTMTRTSSGKQVYDFWGPCLVISTYGAMLVICRVKDVPWIYVIWTLAALFNHLVCRVWWTASKITMHSALLGFSVAPLIPFTALLAIFRPHIIIVFIVELLAIIWSAASAFLSYLSICNVSSENRYKLCLLLPPIVLMHLYLLSLIPVSRH